jgi:hypothetical protein
MADRQLDAKIARTVFGRTVEDRRLWQSPYGRTWHLCPWCNADQPGYCPSSDFVVPPERHPLGPAQATAAGWEVVPFYSADVGAAWEVVENLRARGPHVRVDTAHHVLTGERWRVSVWDLGEPCISGGVGHTDGGGDEVVAWGRTAPEAICLAALKFLGAT